MATATKRRKRATKTDGSVNKAEEIRKAAKEIGGKVRPKDVIAALDAKGITVSSPQVSSTLKAAGYRRSRRRKATATQKANNASSSTDVSLEHLLAAKVLITKLGSVKAAKKALDLMAKLV